MGIAFATTNSYAKPAHHSIKKQAVVSDKRSKSGLRRTSKQKTLSKKTNPVSEVAKPQYTAIRSRHIISMKRSEGQYPKITSAPLDSLSKPSFHKVPLESSFDQERIHSVITSNKSYRFAESGKITETPKHFNSTHGTVETTFNRAAHKAGLSDNLITQLTKIFAWDIDFGSDLNPGDQFTVIYKEQSSSGNHHDNPIIAAEFLTRGKIFTAVRYEDQNGIINYYTPEGKSMQKAFLSTPVDYARISSHFDSHRRHPVLNRIRAHKGVDYAARTGTPVKSAGDGIIAFRGRKGGYGNVLIVKHGERYETLYAHLSGFKKGLEDGERVKQGEIIGYVGQTGLATGPHLHYEFRINGVHQNPESLTHQYSMPLNPKAMADFKSETRPYLAQLYKAKARNLLANNLQSTN